MSKRKFIMPDDRVEQVKIWHEQRQSVIEGLKKVRLEQISLGPKILELDVQELQGKNVLAQKSMLHRQKLNLRMEELALQHQKERLEVAIRGDL